MEAPPSAAAAVDEATAEPSSLDDSIAKWAAQAGYFLPKEDGDAAGNHVKHRYKPPKSDAGGIAVALTVIGVWALIFYHALFQVKLPTDLQQLRTLILNPLPQAIYTLTLSTGSLSLATAPGLSNTTSGLAGLPTVSVGDLSFSDSSNASSSLDAAGGVSAPVAQGSRPQTSSLLHIMAVFFALEFMYTGLFITTHDAMHGTIAMRNRKVNDFLGRLAISLYAWFDYDMLHKKHWEHHNHTGKVGADPDFHRGNPHILPWFVSFMMAYMSFWQFAKIAWWALALQLLGAPMRNLVVFMAGSAIAAAFRLFYYGTYVPHCPEPGPDAGQREMDWTQSRTSSASRLLSFLTCYHFDLHWEHHRWPYAPWWQLPLCRRLAGREAKAA